MERVKMNLTFNTLLGQLTSVKCNVWFPVSIFLHCRYQLKLVTAVSEVSRQSAHRLLVLQLCWCDLWTHWFEKRSQNVYETFCNYAVWTFTQVFKPDFLLYSDPIPTGFFYSCFKNCRNLLLNLYKHISWNIRRYRVPIGGPWS